MVRDPQGFTDFCDFLVHNISAVHEPDHNAVEPRPTRRTALDLKALFALATGLGLIFGCSVGALAWQGDWDQIRAWRDIKERDRYFVHSGPAITSMTGFFHLKNWQFDWDTDQDLRMKGQIPRYMMRPPIGRLDQRKTP